MAEFKYELPNLVKSLQHGWLTSCKTAAVVSVLLAGVSGQFLIFMKDASNFPTIPSPSVHTFLLLTSYSAVAFNCSAALSSLILTDKLGELPIRAARISARRDGMSDGGMVNDTSVRLLVRYGAGEAWVWAMYHWMFCLLAGLLSIMVQILVYVVLEEPIAIQITMICVVSFAVFPPLFFLVKPADQGARDHNRVSSMSDRTNCSPNLFRATTSHRHVIPQSAPTRALN